MKSKKIPALVILFAGMLVFGLDVIWANPAIIQEEAVKKWPNDKEKQADFVKTETSDWTAFKNKSASREVPEKVLLEVKKCCKIRHPKKYCMQWYMLKQELKDYQILQKLKSREQKVFRREAATKWPRSYSMQLYMVKKAINKVTEQATSDVL
jgi:hypothetical protein